MSDKEFYLQWTVTECCTNCINVGDALILAKKLLFSKVYTKNNRDETNKTEGYCNKTLLRRSYKQLKYNVCFYGNPDLFKKNMGNSIDEDVPGHF